jgi:hypothetical protein
MMKRMSEMPIKEQTSTTRPMRRIYQGEEAEI